MSLLPNCWLVSGVLCDAGGRLLIETEGRAAARAMVDRTQVDRLKDGSQNGRGGVLLLLVVATGALLVQWPTIRCTEQCYACTDTHWPISQSITANAGPGNPSIPTALATAADHLTVQSVN